MGSGIAAKVANAGIPVTIIDLPSKEGSRNKITENAKERILKSRPPLLVEKNKIDLISAGNIEDDFNLVGNADWVVEAVVERINIKKGIYKKIKNIRKQDSIISSNTSTIPLKVLSTDMSDEMKKDFRKLILSLSLMGSVTISKRPMYRTGLKKCVIQKFFFI